MEGVLLGGLSISVALFSGVMFLMLRRVIVHDNLAPEGYGGRAMVSMECYGN